MEDVPTVATWTQEGPRTWQIGHSRVFCQMSMTMMRRTVPTSKGGRCRCHCRPGALRPGLGLPQPLGDLLQLSQVQLVRPQGGPPPTRTAPTTSTVGPCGTAKTTNKVPGVAVKQEPEPEVPDKDPRISKHFCSVVLICTQKRGSRSTHDS